MHPQFKVSVGGTTLTGPNDRLLMCEVVDQEGRESDSCTIEIDDRDAMVAIPETGAEMSVAMGYRETGIWPMGLFVVDEVTVEGWPRRMTISARAADLQDKWKEGRSQDYHDKTLGDVVGEIAKRQGLTAKVSPDLANLPYTYLGQTEESDLHFLTRLATKHDATAKPTNGVLVFAKKGLLQTASGLALDGVQAIYPLNVKSYSSTFKDRPKHTSSQGSWWDMQMVRRVEEIGKKGQKGPKFQLPQLWPDGKLDAKAVAQARADKLARDEGNLSITIIGDPKVMAEVPLTVIGVRPGVDGLWRIKTATHTIGSSGYETKIQAELPGSGGE